MSEAARRSKEKLGQTREQGIADMKEKKRRWKMNKEIVIGKDFESHIALLWCQWNAKEITADEFVREVRKVISDKLIREKWIWYNKQRRTTRVN